MYIVYEAEIVATDDDDLEKIGTETLRVEAMAAQLRSLININMYESGIFEMSRYQPSDSGLPYELWFDEVRIIYRENTHTKPRVKILMTSGNFIPVSIDRFPEILLEGILLSEAERELNGKKKDKMFHFISNNCERMLQYWDGNITTMTLFRSLE